jgi:uncharacterized membrane protein
MIREPKIGESEQGSDLPVHSDVALLPLRPEANRANTVPVDLLIALVLTTVATVTVLTESPPVARVPLGLLLVLVLPGFALTAALFPSNDGPDAVARAALSVALSLATIPFVALAIDRSPWRIERVSVTIGLALITTIALIAALILRARLLPDERYAPQIELPAIPSIRNLTRDQKVIGATLLIAVGLFIYGGFDAARTRITGSHTTEFALYNSEGKAEFYPRDVSPGDVAEVQLAVTNHEGRRIQYHVVVSGAGKAIQTIPDFALRDGQSWQGAVRFTVTQADSAVVQFELYRQDLPADSGPYRMLELVVNDNQPTGPR